MKNAIAIPVVIVRNVKNLQKDVDVVEIVVVWENNYEDI
tara:strand:- start:260 stop:376 length:117 start_codon:yes stop_codon:yes gene_type:complete